MVASTIPARADTESFAAYAGGDNRLCYGLRGYLPLRNFLTRLEQAAKQLKLVDQAVNHDEILSDETLAEIRSLDMDGSSSALTLSCLEMKGAVSHLQTAHAHVAGLFKGALKDETEEMLSRLVKLAETRLAEFQVVTDNYELPKRPHEIRRNVISDLIVECDRLIRSFAALLAEKSTSASPDLVEELQLCHAEMEKLLPLLKQLREKSSQKMYGHIRACLESMIVVHLRVEAVELEARSRGGCRVLHGAPIRDWSLGTNC